MTASAGAQTAPPPAASAPPTRGQQIEREAANPLRLIIEASRIQRPVPAPRKDAEPVRPAPREAPRPAPPARPAARDAREAAPNTAPLPQALPVAGAASVPAPAPLPEPSPAVAAPSPTAPVVETPPPPSASPAAAPDLPAQERPPATAASAPAPAVEPAAAPAPAAAESSPLPEAAPRRLGNATLDLPEAAWAKLPASGEILVTLVVETDGSVDRVELPPSLDRDLMRPLRSELRRWRFEPVPRPTPLQIRLVLNRAP